MADMLATPAELTLIMQVTGFDEDTARLLLQLSTAEVQAAAGQRLVAVEDDSITLMGTTEFWLELPERPVTAISSITIDDGDELVEGTDYRRFGSRLWRGCGWSDYIYRPATVDVVYSHGWTVGDQHLELGRAANLAIARQGAVNPSGVLSESIDDYRVQFGAQVASAMEASPYLRASLRRAYGSRAGLVRIG